MIHVPELCSEYKGTNTVDKGGLHFTSVVQMSCNSHCPFREAKVRCDEDSHGFPCNAGEESPSHLSHMKFPVQFPRSQRVLYSVVVKGCCSHRVIKSFAPGTLTGLLTNFVHLKTTRVLLACGLAHTSVLILWQGCLKINSLRICLVLQKKPRDLHYLCCISTSQFFQCWKHFQWETNWWKDKLLHLWVSQKGFFSSKNPPLLCFAWVITYFSGQGLQRGFPISTQQKSPSPHYFFFLWVQLIFN